MILINFLVSQNVISELEARTIEDEANQSNAPVDEILISRNIPEAAILTARNAIYGIPVYNGDRELAEKNIYNLIDKDKAEKYLVIPMSVNFLKGNNTEDDNTRNDFIKNKEITNEIIIGVVDPDRKNALDALQFILASAGVTYKVFLISLTEFKRRFAGYSQDGETAPTLKYTHRVGQLEGTKEDLMDITDEDDNLVEALLDSIPMIKMVNVILKNAISNLASDIHIENIGDSFRVRIRIDGVLATKFIIPVARHQSMVARIKILCGLKLDEKRKPQDGRFSVLFNGYKVDFRVSTFPSYYGEKVVIRILDSYRGVKKLEEIGLSKEHMTLLRKAIDKPYGIILISGPTGSGKTTTLYSILNELDREKENVVSLEDPIEYNIPSMNQSQVFPEIGYTFANGLRSILRQDPDVIMVGEIRDGETAQLAIQAALTGHLVFSTIHTNNSIGVVTRLLDMGVDPYLIAPTLNLAIAQRLTRKIADGCGEEIQDEGMKAIINESFKTLPEEYKKDLNLDRNPYKAVGNEKNKEGLKGRVPVFEMLEVDGEVEQLILKKGTEEQIWESARKNGMITMKEDAMIKSLEGKIPFTEVETL